MAKLTTQYICQNCGSHSPKWIGKCPQCNEWNTYQEEIVEKVKPSELRMKQKRQKEQKTSVALNQVTPTQAFRLPMIDPELTRVLGGGLVTGSVVLLGGEPGIGKSTLLLQLAHDTRLEILYVSGEESAEQIKIRATRMGIDGAKCYIFTETNVENVLEEAARVKPALVIIDSIQTLHTKSLESSPGSVTQVRECTYTLQQFSKQSNVPVFVIGHITKEGSIAGPKVLEHIVDVVLQFEGDQHYHYRVLRALKNRFGSTFEMGLYEMVGNGLRPVENPSELLISQSSEALSGSAISAAIEGLRPFMIEAQALVSTAVYGTAQRSATGYDLRRLHMLLAVLEKRGGFLFANQDVFLNIAGGIRLSDPALDLALSIGLVSSLENIPVSNKWCFAGEIGLSGEIRAVNYVEKRIQEADRLGFERIFVPKNNEKGLKGKEYILEIVLIQNVREVFEHVFG
jgi:DNA repair protein RadA/Sms